MGEFNKSNGNKKGKSCKRLHLWFLASIMLLEISYAFSQEADSTVFSLPEGKSSVTIPFENHNNLIIIPVQIGGSIRSNFILDSGARGTVLIEKVIGDLLDFDYTTEYTVAGAGTQGAVTAYRAENVTLSVDGLNCNPTDIFVLERDYLELPKYLGIEVQGIIGSRFFQDLVVKIDYEDSELEVYDPAKFKAPRRYTGFELEKRQSKPYILGQMRIREGAQDTARFLLDTGASHALLVEMNEENEIALPEEYIESSLGRGLSGDIPGYLGRVHTFSLGEFQLNEVITSFTARYSKIQRKGRVGTIGGELLSRFSVIMDFPQGMLFLKPDDKYRKKFDFNMSGMQLEAFGEDYDRVMVDYVRKDSPAAEAGIQTGDEILKINWIWIDMYSLSHVYSILRSREGRTIRLKILRNGEKMRIKFDLVRMI